MITQHFPECFALFIWRVQWDYSHACCPLARKAFKWRCLFTTTNRKQYCFCPQYHWTFGQESTLVRRAAKRALSSARRGRERVGSCPDWLKLLGNDVHINKSGESLTSQQVVKVCTKPSRWPHGSTITDAKSVWVLWSSSCANSAVLKG